MSKEAVLNIRRHYDGMPLPSRAHPSDAGFDLTAMGVETLRPGVYAFDSGISVRLSAGFYCEVVPRSSIVKTDFMMANGVGVIDPDYRGRIRVVLRYLGPGDGEAEAHGLLGQRMAQLLVKRPEPVRLQEAAALDAPARGQSAFGRQGR